MTKVKNVGPYGGRRDRAGRKRNPKPTLWMQLAVNLSDEELAMVQALTTTQRRDCLVSKANTKSQLTVEADVLRQFHNVRLRLKSPKDRTTISALSEVLRRQRLLSTFVMIPDIMESPQEPS